MFTVSPASGNGCCAVHCNPSYCQQHPLSLPVAETGTNALNAVFASASPRNAACFRTSFIAVTPLSGHGARCLYSAGSVLTLQLDWATSHGVYFSARVCGYPMPVEEHTHRRHVLFRRS